MHKAHIIAIGTSLLILLVCFLIYRFAPVRETVTIKTIAKESTEEPDSVVIAAVTKDRSPEENSNAAYYANFEHAIDLLIDYTN